MSYIEQFETELKAKLNGPEGQDAIVRWVSEKVLESYRNGVSAGHKGTIRRRGSVGKAE